MRHQQRWTVGGISRDAARQWKVTTDVELTNQRFEELRHGVLFVSRLAAQRDFGRLLRTVARWADTVEHARKELTDEGVVSRATRQAAVLDLVAVARAADRLEQGLVDEVGAATDVTGAAVEAFNEIRHRIRAMPDHLLVHELARQAAEDGIDLVLVDGVVHIGKRRERSARDIAAGLLGNLHWLASAHLAVFEERFQEVATAIESAAEDVREGTPCLIEYDGRMNFIDLPLTEIAALRRFFDERRAARGPEHAVRAMGALTQASLRERLTIAGVDVTVGIVASRSSTGVDELPASQIELDLDLLGSTPVEYSGAVRYSLERGGVDDEMFTGAVQRAAIEEPVAALSCEGAVELLEHNARGLVAANVSGGEVVRSITLQAGLPADIIPISEEAGEEAEEDFEVLVPVRGIEVSEPMAVGPVEIVPLARGEQALEGLQTEPDVAAGLATEFRDGTSYGLARITAAALHEAEDAGWATIEVAMAWLAVRGRYGLARLPGGRMQPFSRAEALRAPAIGDVVLVRGITSGRTWLRSRGAPIPLERTLDADSALLDPPLPAELTPAERQAFLSLRRATAETVVESQLQALWEAIEFYVAGTRVPKLFSADELERLRALLPEELDEAQGDAFTNGIGNLNVPPLLVRLDHRLRGDGVPLADAERELLFGKLRGARNDTAHGRPVKDPPTREEMNRGIALVARMLVHKVSQETE